MRKLIVSMNLSLDGFAADPDGSLAWHLPSWSEELEGYLCRQLARADTLLLGRATFAAMAAYWPRAAASGSCAGEGPLLRDMMQHHAKVVVSRTTLSTEWNNSTLLSGPLEMGLRAVKAGAGKSIIVYGSLSLIPALVVAGLVDELQLWTYPVLLGRGRPMFHNLREAERFRPEGIIRFRTGVVLQTFGRLARHSSPEPHIGITAPPAQAPGRRL